MLEYITDVTVLIIEIVCYFTFFDIFAVKRNRNKIEVILSIIILMLSSRLCVHFLKKYTIIKMLLMVLIIILAMWFLYEISLVKTLILVFFVQSIVTITDYIVIMILAKIYGDITTLGGA